MCCSDKMLVSGVCTCYRSAMDPQHLSGRAGRCCIDLTGPPPRGTLLTTPPMRLFWNWVRTLKLVLREQWCKRRASRVSRRRAAERQRTYCSWLV